MSSSSVKYTQQTKVYTVVFQELEHIQHKLKKTNNNQSVQQLKILNDMILQLVMMALCNSGHKQQNIDWMERKWKLDKDNYFDRNETRKCAKILYSWYKEQCITETCQIYNNGDTGGTTWSANLMSNDKMTEKMLAIE